MPSAGSPQAETVGSSEGMVSRLDDIAFDHNLFSGWIVFALIAAAIATAITCILLGPLLFWLLIFLPAATIVFVGVLARRNAVVNRILERTANSDLRSALVENVHRLRSIDPPRTVRWLVERLASRGHAGVALRIAPRQALDPIEPFEVPFEPTALDGCDWALTHLAGDEPPAEAGREQAMMARRVRRNVLLKGGWLLVAFFGLNVVIHGVESLQQRRVTLLFVYWLMSCWHGCFCRLADVGAFGASGSCCRAGS
jgi:hypothetical protein